MHQDYVPKGACHVDGTGKKEALHVLVWCQPLAEDLDSGSLGLWHPHCWLHQIGSNSPCWRRLRFCHGRPCSPLTRSATILSQLVTPWSHFHLKTYETFPKWDLESQNHTSSNHHDDHVWGPNLPRNIAQKVVLEVYIEIKNPFVIKFPFRGYFLES